MRGGNIERQSSCGNAVADSMSCTLSDLSLDYVIHEASSFHRVRQAVINKNFCFFLSNKIVTPLTSP
jgi:hypothetical protein